LPGRLRLFSPFRQAFKTWSFVCLFPPLFPERKFAFSSLNAPPLFPSLSGPPASRTVMYTLSYCTLRNILHPFFSFFLGFFFFQLFRSLTRRSQFLVDRFLFLVFLLFLYLPYPRRFCLAFLSCSLKLRPNNLVRLAFLQKRLQDPGSLFLCC